MKRLAPALCTLVLAAAWSVPADTAAGQSRARERGARPAQAQRAPQRAPHRSAPARSAPPRRMTQPRRPAGAGRAAAAPPARGGAVRRATPRTSAPARATAPRTAGRSAPGRRIGGTAPRTATRAAPGRTAPRQRVGATAPRDAGRTRAVARTPNRRIGGTAPRTTTRTVPGRTAPRRRTGATTPRDTGRAVGRTPNRRVGATAPRGGGRTGVVDRTATRVAPADAARRRGARPRGGAIGNGRSGGRIADAVPAGRTGRRGATVVDRRAPRGNAIRRADAPLSSRPIVINNYVDGGRRGQRGQRGYRSYRGRHRYGVPHLYGSYFYFPGYNTFSLGVAVGSGLRHYDPYWNGYYGHRYGYAAYDWGPRYDYTGSLRLKIRPRFAEVYVDGYYAGQVDNYDGIFQRLRLEEGPHHIEIRQPGYVPLEFEVMTLTGETITYEGFLEPF